MTQTSKAGAVSATAESEDDDVVVVEVVSAAAANVEGRAAAAALVIECVLMEVSSNVKLVSSSLSVAGFGSCCALHDGLVPGELDERDGGEGGDHGYANEAGGGMPRKRTAPAHVKKAGERRSWFE